MDEVNVITISWWPTYQSLSINQSITTFTFVPSDKSIHSLSFPLTNQYSLSLSLSFPLINQSIPTFTFIPSDQSMYSYFHFIPTDQSMYSYFHFIPTDQSLFSTFTFIPTDQSIYFPASITTAPDPPSNLSIDVQVICSSFSVDTWS